MQANERQVSSVPVSSVPLRMRTEGTDGRGTKSPLPIHSFQRFRERMGTIGNGRNGWSKRERIRCAGGVAFVARDLRDVLREFENNQQESNHAQN